MNFQFFFQLIPCFNVPNFGLEIFMFPVMEMIYSNCKGNVDSGISTLMSISDQLSLSICRQRMEKTRRVGE